jgi:hypothetical protein
MSLTRLRLAVLAAVYVVLGVSAGGIFDRFVWVLAIAPVVPIGLVALTVARRWVWRIGATIIGILAATALAVYVVGGNVSDIVTAFGCCPRSGRARTSHRSSAWWRPGWRSGPA